MSAPDPTAHPMPTAPEPDEVYTRICQLLDHHQIAYEASAHPRAHNAQQAAALRGTPLEWGAKTLLLKVGKGAAAHFSLFTLRACDALHRGRLRKHFGTDRIRFATEAELHALTGLSPGAVPPFGAPIFADLGLYIDATYAERAAQPQAQVYFTAGRRDRSLKMSLAAHVRLAAPQAIYDFSELPA